MDSVFAVLKETPIPTILVVVGIAFLLLSIVGQLAGRIRTHSTERAIARHNRYPFARIGSIALVVCYSDSFRL